MTHYAFPRDPGRSGKYSFRGQDLADESTVEYALVYEAEKPRLERYLLHCGVRCQSAEELARRAHEELYRLVRPRG